MTQSDSNFPFDDLFITYNLIELQSTSAFRERKSRYVECVLLKGPVILLLGPS